MDTDDDDEDGDSCGGDDGGRSRRSRRRGNAGGGGGDNQRGQLTTSKSTNAVLERTGDRGSNGFIGEGGLDGDGDVAAGRVRQDGGGVNDVVIDVGSQYGDACANDVDGRARLHHRGEHGFLSDASSGNPGNEHNVYRSDSSNHSNKPSNSYHSNACSARSSFDNTPTHNQSILTGVTIQENNQLCTDLPRVPSYHSIATRSSNSSLNNQDNILSSNHNINRKYSQSTPRALSIHNSNDLSSHSESFIAPSDDNEVEEEREDVDDVNGEDEDDDDEDDASCYELASSACHALSSLPDEVTRSDPGSLASRATSGDEEQGDPLRYRQSITTTAVSRKSSIASNTASTHSRQGSLAGRMSRKDSFLASTPSDDHIVYVLNRRPIGRVTNDSTPILTQEPVDAVPGGPAPLAPVATPTTTMAALAASRRRFDYRIIAELRNAPPSTKDDTINTDSCAESCMSDASGKQGGSVISSRCSSSRLGSHSGKADKGSVNGSTSSSRMRSTRNCRLSSRTGSSSSGSRVNSKSGRSSRHRTGETPGRAVCSRCEGILRSNCSSASSYASTTSNYSSFDSTDDGDRTTSASTSSDGSDQSTPCMSPNHSPLPLHRTQHKHHHTPTSTHSSPLNQTLHSSSKDLNTRCSVSDVECRTSGVVSLYDQRVSLHRAPIASQESLLHQMMQSIPMADASSVSSFTSDDSDGYHVRSHSCSVANTPSSTTTPTPTDTAANTLTRESQRGIIDEGEVIGEMYVENGDDALSASDTDSTTGDNFTTTEDDEVCANYRNHQQMQLQHERQRRHLQRSNEFQRAIEEMFRDAIVYSSSDEDHPSSGDFADDYDGDNDDTTTVTTRVNKIHDTRGKIDPSDNTDNSMNNCVLTESASSQVVQPLQPTLQHNSLVCTTQISPQRHPSNDSSADEDLPPPPPLTLQISDLPPPPSPHLSKTTYDLEFNDVDFPPIPCDYISTTLPTVHSQPYASSNYESSTLPHRHHHSNQDIERTLPPPCLPCANPLPISSNSHVSYQPNSPLDDPLPPPQRALILSTIYSDVETNTHEDNYNVNDCNATLTMPLDEDGRTPSLTVKEQTNLTLLTAYAIDSSSITDCTSHDNDEYSDSDDLDDDLDAETSRYLDQRSRVNATGATIKCSSFEARDDEDDCDEEDVGDILDRCDVAPIRESTVAATFVENLKTIHMSTIAEAETGSEANYFLTNEHSSSECRRSPANYAHQQPSSNTSNSCNIVDSPSASSQTTLKTVQDNIVLHVQHRHRGHIELLNDSVFESSSPTLMWSTEERNSDAHEDELDTLLMRAVAPCDEDALVA